MKQKTYRIRVDIAAAMLLGEVQPDLRDVLDTLRACGVLHDNQDFPRRIEYDTTREPNKQIAIWKRNGFNAEIKTEK